jgi:uncharacterized protein
MNMNFRSLPTLFIQAALVATAGALAIVLVTKYVAPLPLSVNQTTTQKESAFNVTGKSSITTAPDKAVLTLGVTQKAADLKQAQNSANTIMENLHKQLSTFGIKKQDIKTQNYSINPNYDYSKNGQNIIGYSVDITLAVNLTDFSQVNQVVDTATSLGINQVNGVQFTLSDAKEAEVRSQARKEAIEDAKRNANELASLAGMKLGRIINVSEGMMNVPRPMEYLAKDMAQSNVAVAPTSIQPGSTTYGYTVTLSYETN